MFDLCIEFDNCLLFISVSLRLFDNTNLKITSSLTSTTIRFIPLTGRSPVRQPRQPHQARQRRPLRRRPSQRAAEQLQQSGRGRGCSKTTVPISKAGKKVREGT
jgi:hypothetical protein